MKAGLDYVILPDLIKFWLYNNLVSSPQKFLTACSAVTALCPYFVRGLRAIMSHMGVKVPVCPPLAAAGGRDLSKALTA